MSSKDETAALSSNTVDDISNDIGTMGICNNNETSAAAAACDMSTSKKEMMSSGKKDTSCDQKLDNVKTGTNIDICGTCTDDTAEDSCANCGKEGASNTCNKCKSVKYCNAACKKKHKTKHKKACERLQEEERRRAAELRLFKNPPQKDDCPICFLLLPYVGSGYRYKACCGKIICSGCIHAVMKTDGGVGLCPFCRTPTPETDEEVVKGLQKRVDIGDAEAMSNLGSHYSQGVCGLPQDYTKAFELYHRAAELGHAPSLYYIAYAYFTGNGVEIDEKMAIHYLEKGAIKGAANARHILGEVFEGNEINKERAIKHYLIAVKSGFNKSLKEIQQFYSKGKATKADYTEALRAYQKYLDEVKSDQRDEAAAFDEEYKYIE